MATASAAAMETQMPLIAQNNGKINTATTGKINVLKKERTKETAPFERAVKNSC